MEGFLWLRDSGRENCFKHDGLYDVQGVLAQNVYLKRIGLCKERKGSIRCGMLEERAEESRRLGKSVQAGERFNRQAV